MEFTAQQIAQYIGGVIEGKADASVHTFAKIEEGVEGALSFYYDPKFEPYVYQTRSTIILVPSTFQPAQPVKATLVRVDDPRMAIGRLLSLYESMKPKRTGIDPLAYVSPTAKIGKDVYLAPFAAVGDGAEIGDGTALHPHATVGAGAKVGKDCILYANATVYHDCRVGDRCILHAGSVVGADGFGFAPSADGYEKIPQIGIAVLEDDVELGANACVDRATMGATIIHNDVKIDNLVQVGHNVEVKSHTVLCAQVGIAGSTTVGEWCTFTGQVGVAGHISIADRTTLGAQSGVPGNIRKPGQTLMGYPAIDPKVFARSSAVFKTLPDMAIQLRQLQKEVEALKSQIANSNS
ncbi:MAG: UDP-3-O-(3-hydroxymyristoyl)glucosamine N-acyltransferase [Bacteroidaceae bacterium]|nr:UDP-3-O-(3-hydroxymyristoyl)glucosamine N-acyltransferase [Bacteroidaceae bacterium]